MATVKRNVWPDACQWSIAERLSYAIERQEVKPTHEELGEVAGGITRGAVSQWISGKTRPDYKRLAALAEFLGCSPNWLITGTPDTAAEFARYPSREMRKVPIISWTQAGDWANSIDDYAVGDGFGFEWVPGVSKHAFALKVEGRSMEPDYREGSIIVVDPEIEAFSGDDVVAKRADEQTTFKQLVIEGGKRFLYPINESFKAIEMTEHDQIIGVVVKHIRSPRKERRR